MEGTRHEHDGEDNSEPLNFVSLSVKLGTDGRYRK